MSLHIIRQQHMLIENESMIPQISFPFKICTTLITYVVKVFIVDKDFFVLIEIQEILLASVWIEPRIVYD